MAQVVTRDKLALFLREAASEPFVFGYWDCAMTLANWVYHVSGKDPAAVLRGSYDTDMGWKRIVVAMGGLDVLIERFALEIGMRPTKNPMAGDIGVILVDGLGQAGGIRTYGRWAVKLDRGVIAAPFETVSAWGWER